MFCIIIANITFELKVKFKIINSGCMVSKLNKYLTCFVVGGSYFCTLIAEGVFMVYMLIMTSDFRYERCVKVPRQIT